MVSSLALTRMGGTFWMGNCMVARAFGCAVHRFRDGFQRIFNRWSCGSHCELCCFLLIDCGLYEKWVISRKVQLWRARRRYEPYCREFRRKHQMLEEKARWRFVAICNVYRTSSFVRENFSSFREQWVGIFEAILTWNIPVYVPSLRRTKYGLC